MGKYFYLPFLLKGTVYTFLDALQSLLDMCSYLPVIYLSADAKKILEFRYG